MQTLNRLDSAGYMTNWAARLFARAVDHRLKELGLSSGQLPVFFALAAGEELPQKTLTRIAAIEQPTMAATLARMERDGLIARKPDPSDKRSALIALTPAALEKVPLLRQAIAEVNMAALTHLTVPERESYLAHLRAIIAALGAMPGDE